MRRIGEKRRERERLVLRKPRELRIPRAFQMVRKREALCKPSSCRCHSLDSALSTGDALQEAPSRRNQDSKQNALHSGSLRTGDSLLPPRGTRWPGLEKLSVLWQLPQDRETRAEPEGCEIELALERQPRWTNGV